MDLSIILVTYNAREISLRTLELYRRAIAADPGHHYELIVADNASRDACLMPLQRSTQACA